MKKENAILLAASVALVVSVATYLMRGRQATVDSAPAPSGSAVASAPASTGDLWAACPPTEQRDSSLNYTPISAFGDLVSVRQLDAPPGGGDDGGGTGMATAEFVTCDTRAATTLKLKDLVPAEALAHAMEPWASFGAREFFPIDEVLPDFPNFAVQGLDEASNTLLLMIGASGPHGELDALPLQVQLTPEQVAALRARMAGPRPSPQPFEHPTRELFRLISSP
jgi:hypothetical protein